MPASACANVVQSAAARVVHPQAGVFASSKNETQQLYVVGQVPPVPCAQAQVMFAVSSSQLQVVPPLVPAVPVPPLVPAVPDVC